MPKKNVKWPTCINALTPFPQPLGATPPDDLVNAFRQLGWPDDTLPVRMITLLGTCTTDKYKEDRNLPEWHQEHAEEDEGYLEDTGRYFWCDFDLMDRNGVATRLRMTFNAGDADCNDGTWGMVWDRDSGESVADLTSVGDCEGRVELKPKKPSGYAPHGLPVPDDNEAFEACKLPFTLVYASDAEFEKLLGIAMRWCFSCSREK
ncbi:MAG: hypothetical protein U0792_22895 [Gemmataceae bacterium]